MFRQAIASSSRALRSAPRIAQPLRQQFQPAAAVYSPSAFQPLAARWYSDAKEGEAGKAADAKDEVAAAGDEVAQLKKDLEAKDAEAREWKDKCLRTVADFRNLQDRTQRDVKTARDFAIQKFAKDLVDSVDNLDRALTTVPAEKLNVEKNESNQDLLNLHEGLKMTETILIQTLAKHGLERVDPTGEKFNPNEHEATFMTPQPDKENNIVFFTQQKGFKLNGRVLRAAKVGVVKNA
ncbi:Putative GrpE protein homolog [[Torrubiella] hemipterigena]|uniref:GrpE protein homolog n=1 Tax=[Torrubiella] hemipterigena TaxID=1531966 RepID=A0A0A1TEH9_9HYPO|nr:Putative GrpE protein homolog [[Torrubiella] hemipterigena]